jgi:uncharacterized tellurite resistance protein B-like protein
MEMKIKKSVATLLAHIIKIDKRDIAKEAPLFCKLLGADFGCDDAEAKEMLEATISEDYNLDEHIDIINDALKDDRLSKMHILEQLNHMIYSDKIESHDYDVFEKIKNRLFAEK